MIVIGIIGRIGAGKSTVARLLADHGARVIDADRIAHDVLLEADVREAIVVRYGPGVITAGATPGTASIERKALAAMVFGPTIAHRQALADLEAIVHPRVHRRMEALLAEVVAAERTGTPESIVVLDVPLLVRGGWLDRLSLIHI